LVETQRARRELIRRRDGLAMLHRYLRDRARLSFQYRWWIKPLRRPQSFTAKDDLLHKAVSVSFRKGQRAYPMHEAVIVDV
jgi:hypothetical protein